MKDFLVEYSGWYFLLCLLAGALYAWVLYKKEPPWGERTNRVLAAVRFVLVTLICLLLIGPYIKDIRNYFEKPTVVLAIDNSQSITLVSDTVLVGNILKKFDDIRTKLQDAGYLVDIELLGNLDTDPERVQDIRFEASTTDLSSLLRRIQVNYENKNLAEVVLFSDGIYNQGVSPDFTAYPMRISTLAIGDTLPQVDINLKAVYANKIAYLGNRFPLVAEILNTGFEGQTTQVVLMHKGKELQRKSVSFTSTNGIQNIDFLVSAQEEGMQRYTLEILPLNGEFTQENNRKNVFIDVLDGKEKILLVAASPHPDIKAIRSVVEKNENYDFVVHIPGMLPGPLNQEINYSDKYDLVIFHQVPNIRGIGEPIWREILKRGFPVWYIVGNQTDIMGFNQQNKTITIVSSGRQADRVTPEFNNAFTRFNYETDKRGTLTKSPPVAVPYGNYDLNGSAEVILYQKIGSVSTEKPLLAVSEHDGKKTAVLVGEGLWQWKLHEFSTTNKDEAFTELVSKVIQFLSTKEDKRRFRVYTTSEEYLDTETVFFDTEVYNEIYEKIYGQKIDLQITNETGESVGYTYVNNTAGYRYAVKGLDQGIYRYTASTTLDGKVEYSEGQFTVRKLEIEAVNTTANFNLLRNLSAQTNGGHFTVQDLDALEAHLLANRYPDIIHTQEEFQQILNYPWIMLLLLVLATAEWVARKVKGGY